MQPRSGRSSALCRLDARALFSKPPTPGFEEAEQGSPANLSPDSPTPGLPYTISPMVINWLSNGHFDPENGQQLVVASRRGAI
jgi:hypothetical protein